MEQLDRFLDFFCQPSLARAGLMFLLGLCVGSFLNVLALRSLEERGLMYPPSSCPKCKHRLSVFDLIPVVSFLLLQGRCRYCKQSISWQYPVVELVTAISFVIVVQVFAHPGNDCFHALLLTLGMLAFVGTLIAVCITDFREKLIPHEITYPAMLLGILFSATVRSKNGPGDEVLSTLAGIGISYILFDFLAFYGLKFYIWMHGDPTKQPEEEEHGDEIDALIDRSFDIAPPKAEEEEFEVMGGGDAVLSAVIAAWLGLQRLAIALVVGFLMGVVLGAVYLLAELRQQKMLGLCVRPILIGTSLVVLIVEGVLWGFSNLFSTMHPPWLPAGLCAALCGAVLGVLWVGKKVSKPFPFGPALAAGAVVAMFINPGSEL